MVVFVLRAVSSMVTRKQIKASRQVGSSTHLPSNFVNVCYHLGQSSNTQMDGRTVAQISVGINT